MNKYDFYFSQQALDTVLNLAEFESHPEKTRMFWRGEEFTLLVKHGKEFNDLWGDLEYVGTGSEDEIEVQEVTEEDYAK